MTHTDTVTALADMNLPQSVRDGIARLSGIRETLTTLSGPDRYYWLRDQAKVTEDLARTLRSLSKESARLATAYRPERLCDTCGDPMPADRSCDCFDNGCQ